MNERSEGRRRAWPAVVAGDPAASTIITAVRYEDIDLEMPPVKCENRVKDGDTIRVGGLELEVALGVVRIGGAGPLLEQVHAADALAEVPPEGLLRGHEQHMCVGRLVQLVADALPHAGQPARPSSRTWAALRHVLDNASYRKYVLICDGAAAQFDSPIVAVCIALTPCFF